MLPSDGEPRDLVLGAGPEARRKEACTSLGPIMMQFYFHSTRFRSRRSSAVASRA